MNKKQKSEAVERVLAGEISCRVCAQWKEEAKFFDARSKLCWSCYRRLSIQNKVAAISDKHMPRVGHIEGL